MTLHNTLDTDHEPDRVPADTPTLRERLIRRLGGPAAALDAVLLIAFTLFVFLVAKQVDALEALIEWSEHYEEYEIDEIFTLMIVSSCTLCVFVSRRVKELNAEIGRRDKAEQRIRHVAMHDPLTGLPNRVMFRNRLQQELLRADRENQGLAVFAIDLDRFKQINDLYGHAAGDELLRALTARLLDTARRSDTVARLSGDEFSLIQSGLSQPEGSAQLAARLMQAMSTPIQLEDQQIICSLSIGIAVVSPGLRDAENLLRSADVALYRAKADGRGTFRFFETDMDLRLRERQKLERDLRDAIAADELTVHYQPLVTLADRKLVGFEALMRWTHAERGPVSPVDFIPLAEESGLILDLGDWVLEKACRDAMRWSGEYRIAVNLSPVQFRHRDLSSRVETILKRTGLPASRLELEVTEGVLIDSTEEALGVLCELKELGIRISMDDFGTGYSSLSYLKRFPFDKIKIDRSFISHLASAGEDAAIVRAILAMGDSLGMVTTAEGVESDEQLDYLRAEGCDEAQGFLLGKPADFDAAAALAVRAERDEPL